jgi:hypothetical protein
MRLVLLVAMGVFAGEGWGQLQPIVPEREALTPVEPRGGWVDPIPGLDELLGLEPVDDRRVGPDALPSPAVAELERRLTGEEAAEELDRAVRLMGDAAARLASNPGDTGITTQRLQEEIVRKLQAVIDSARENESDSNSSSSSSSQQQQQAGQQQQQGSEASAERSSQASGEAESTPPTLGEGELSPESIADSARWGALPERLRGALLQGFNERFSSLYEQMTRRYYERLAETAREDDR